MTYDENVALCALNKIFGYHPTQALKRMEEAGGSALALFDAHSPDPQDPSQLEWAAGELERVRSGGFRFLSILDEDYPQPLRECPAPPLGLYLNGSSSPTEIFGLRPMVAFVGTRDLSQYGQVWCQKLVRGLSEARIPPVIVSGLALGVDAVAHQTALQCGLPTVGVMATGIDQVYPWQHEKLAMSIVRSPGSGLLTDYPLDTAPVALNFLRRNRIIAGLVSAVVVVESKHKGGSLMTAKYAVDFGRDVYALPGRADDLRSEGCNSLIHENMARIITCPEQLADDLGLGVPHRHRGGSWATPGSDDPAELLRAHLVRRYGPGSPMVPVGLAIRENRGATPDVLASLLQRPYAEVLSAIGTLEADGIVVSDLLRRCSLSAAWS